MHDCKLVKIVSTLKQSPLAVFEGLQASIENIYTKRSGESAGRPGSVSSLDEVAEEDQRVEVNINCRTLECISSLSCWGTGTEVCRKVEALVETATRKQRRNKSDAFQGLVVKLYPGRHILSRR